jgi:Fic family protein
MYTLRLFAAPQFTVPATAAWYLCDLGEHLGKQQLYTRQSPQRLKALREHALIESAVSSNRIEGDIVERSSDGRERVRFKTVPAAETSGSMAALVADWDAAVDGRWAPPLILLAAFNLDFLCIHPFRDGNGRVSRLLWLLQSYRFGYEVGRYVSLERLVEENKERYYETLDQSSQGWHDGRHDPWPYINYVLSIMKAAYREFEARVGDVKAPRGAKRELVLAGIERLLGAARRGFAISQLERACPGVSRDMVRRVLREEQRAGRLACEGRGPAAVWKRKG